MTDSEMFAFVSVCNDLMRVFPKRLQEHERSQLHRDYFKAMRRFTLVQIEAGAEIWMQRGKYFPKPAEWMDAIPRQPQASVDYPVLSEADSREYRRAEQLRYEDGPCHCSECIAADITEKPLRFVPELSADGSDRKAKDGERVVVAGHWAHGWELQRYYQAQSNFWELCHARGLTSIAKALTKGAA